jgi:hypothetical protein
MTAFGFLWRWVFCLSVAVFLSLAFAEVVPMNEVTQYVVSFVIGAAAGLIAFRWWRA